MPPSLRAKAVQCAFTCLLSISAALCAYLCRTRRCFFSDDFGGPSLDTDKMASPGMDTPDGATFLGRTQLRVSQTLPLPLPPLSNGAVRLPLSTYNPSALVPGDSFYGSEVISNATFQIGSGLVIEVRARFAAPISREWSEEYSATTLGTAVSTTKSISKASRQPPEPSANPSLRERAAWGGDILLSISCRTGARYPTSTPIRWKLCRIGFHGTSMASSCGPTRRMCRVARCSSTSMYGHLQPTGSRPMTLDCSRRPPLRGMSITSWRSIPLSLVRSRAPGAAR